MAEGGNHAPQIVGPAMAGPLLAGLNDPDADIRIQSLWALIALPLSTPTWRSVAAYANATVAGRGVALHERNAVVSATPWIPMASIRNTVAQLARGELGDDDDVRRVAVEVTATMSRPARDDPAWKPVEPAGFTVLSEVERQRLTAPLAGLTEEELWAEVNALWVSDARAALAVTLLVERAGTAGDAELAYRVVRWVASRAAVFRPDVEGLFNEFRRLREEHPDAASVIISWQIGWLVSRGGLIPLLIDLDTHLTSRQRGPRLAALALVQYAAAFQGWHSEPTYGVGVGIDPVDPRPGIPMPTAVFDDVEGAAPARPIDEDVQFTVYRPTGVQPDRWYPLLAFAHRTGPIEDASGALVSPIDEVARQAASVLSGSPGPFDFVRADSEAGLRRGTDLLFEPWLDQGEINPPTASLRWEEPIHRVEFRLRVPRSAEGSRVKGGLRVFTGPVLIGEVRFQLPVSATTTAASPAMTPTTAKRFRQIFASYSHRDAAVVEEVERFTTLTGDRYMIDVRSLRSGEIWSDRLGELIDQADIFQLFWSRNAMYSPFVRQEWEHALRLRREGFVRPVYWDDPLPTDRERDLPPEELQRLHFSRLAARPSGGSASVVIPPGATAEVPTTGIRSPAPVTPGARKKPATRNVAPTRSPQPGDLICGECGEANSPSRKFCGRCGASLASASTFPPTWWRRIVPRRRRKALVAGERPWNKDVPSPGEKDKPRWFVAIRWVVGLAIALLVLIALVALI
jgi:TIR domain